MKNENKDSLRRNPSVDYIAARWCMLPPHVRETMITLVDAGLLTSHPPSQTPRAEEATQQ